MLKTNWSSLKTGLRLLFPVEYNAKHYMESTHEKTRRETGEGALARDCGPKEGYDGILSGFPFSSCIPDSELKKLVTWRHHVAAK